MSLTLHAIAFPLKALPSLTVAMPFNTLYRAAMLLPRHVSTHVIAAALTAPWYHLYRVTIFFSDSGTLAVASAV
jgi:hypothetical protein